MTPMTANASVGAGDLEAARLADARKLYQDAQDTMRRALKLENDNRSPMPDEVAHELDANLLNSGHALIEQLEAALSDRDRKLAAALAALKPFAHLWLTWHELAHTGDMEISFIAWLEAYHFDESVTAHRQAADNADAPAPPPVSE